MKNVFNFIFVSLLLFPCLLFSQIRPLQVLYTGEVYITLVNTPSSYNVDFSISPLDAARWDENLQLTTNYGEQSESLNNYNGGLHLNIDLVTSMDGSGMVMALGFYRISANDAAYGAYIDVDWRTSVLAGNTSYGSPDLILEYDVQNHFFKWPDNSASINGSTLYVWEWSGNIESKDYFEPYSPVNLTVDEQSENYPILNWDHDTQGTDYLTGYKVYRCITQTSTETPTNFALVATVSSTSTTYSDQQVEFGHWNFAHYKIKAINGNVESSFSNEADASLITLLNKKNNESNLTNKTYNNGLLQNYPNPFNPSTKIYYAISSNGVVKLQIFDILGNKVADLVNEIKSAGEYYASFDGRNLPSGMYICKLQSGNYSESKKILLVK